MLALHYTVCSDSRTSVLGDRFHLANSMVRSKLFWLGSHLFHNIGFVIKNLRTFFEI